MNIDTPHRSLNCSRRPGPRAGVAADPVWVVVALSGDIDVASKRALSILDAAVAENPGARILVDLNNVTFLDSSALNAFRRARAQAVATGGTVSLHGASSSASRLLQIWHLDQNRRCRPHEPSRMNMNPATPGTRDQPSRDPEAPENPRAPHLPRAGRGDLRRSHGPLSAHPIHVTRRRATAIRRPI